MKYIVEDGNGVFKSLANLQILTLALNNITEILKSAFEGLTSVKHLDISNNNITSVQKYTFDEMTMLEVILLLILIS